MQPTPGGIKGFATRPVGRAVLLAIAIVTVAFGTIYLSQIIGVAILLLFGLALPIYMGWKRPRGLALAGAVILLLSPALAAALDANEYLQAPGPASSFGSSADGEYGGSVLQHAYATPYNPSGGGVVRFDLTVEPRYLDPNASLLAVTVFVSVCPEASQANQTTPVCSPPYPSHEVTQSFATPPSSTTNLTFNVTLDGPNIWWWTAWASWNYSNATGPTHYIFLNANNGYNDILGPVVGDFFAVYTLVVLPVYLAIVILPGLVFYVALLFYTWFKAREARRKAMARVQEASDTTPSAATSAPRDADAAPKTEELRCPKCGAVVYTTESQCWKCGTSLSTSTAAPLPPAAGTGRDEPPLR